MILCIQLIQFRHSTCVNVRLYYRFAFMDAVMLVIPVISPQNRTILIFIIATGIGNWKIIKFSKNIYFICQNKDNHTKHKF